MNSSNINVTQDNDGWPIEKQEWLESLFALQREHGNEKVRELLRALQNQALKPANGGKVWCFIGDGESDEPEVLVCLGTDGYGLSESRPVIRDHFGVSAEYIIRAAGGEA